MKILKVLLLLLIVIGCTQPETITEKETIIKETIYTDNMIFESLQIFPLEGNRAPKDDDFDDGIMYIENANATDGIIHNLDLSSIIGLNKSALVWIQIKVVAEGQDNGGEIFTSFFRPAGYTDINWTLASASYDNPTDLIPVLTDDTGNIEWYHDYMWPFWINPGCEPGFEIYKWVDIEVWIFAWSEISIVN